MGIRKPIYLPFVVSCFLLVSSPVAAKSGLIAPARREPSDQFVLALTGDAIGPSAPTMTTGDRRIVAISKILHTSDAAFGNQEGSMFDIATFSGTEMAPNGGGIPLCPAAVAIDLRRLGITVMSKANNHAIDWGTEGLAASEKSLDAAGISHAGSGADEAAARAPVFLDTPHGKLALVATTSTYPEAARAGPEMTWGGVKLHGRPGVSGINLNETILVTQTEMATLKRIAERRSDPPGTFGDVDPTQSDQLHVADLHSGEQSYKAAKPQGLHFDADEADVGAILTEIQKARLVTKHVLFSIHAHETASGAVEDQAPADFLQPLFHRAIDAGAEVVVRHGPHSLKGIEIYKGRPIFYGMGSFFMGMGGSDRKYHGARLPPSWDRSVIAVVSEVQGYMSEIKLYPIVTIRESGPLMGSPMRAHPAEARKILTDLQAASAPYGTKIQIRDEIGIIKAS